MDFKWTKQQEIDGLTAVIHSGKILNSRMHKITLRVTKDESGRNMSLADELRGIMMEVPCEPVMDLLKWLVEE